MPPSPQTVRLLSHSLTKPTCRKSRVLTKEKAKLTSTLHLLIPRLRLLQKKSSAQSVHQRRELSVLLAEGRDESARIRVENVIATDTAVEVMEMVELYCELVLARANLLDQVAFSEKGVGMRGDMRSYYVQLQKQQQQGSQPGKAGQDATGEKKKEKKESGLFSFSFWRSNPSSPAPSSSSSTVQQNQPKDTTPTPTPTESDPESTPEPQPEEKEYISPPLDTATTSIIYAQARFPTEVRELTLLRALLTERYGKEFAALAADDRVPGVRVPAKLVKALRVRAPSEELVDSYLGEIARAYAVRSERYNPEGHGLDSPAGGGDGEGDVGEGDAGEKKKGGDAHDDDGGKSGSPGGKIPEVDDLTKRFAALRRL